MSISCTRLWCRFSKFEIKSTQAVFLRAMREGIRDPLCTEIVMEETFCVRIALHKRWYCYDQFSTPLPTGVNLSQDAQVMQYMEATSMTFALHSFRVPWLILKMIVLYSQGLVGSIQMPQTQAPREIKAVVYLHELLTA